MWPPQRAGPRQGGSEGGELGGGQEMDGVKTSVCVSHGERGRMMLQVLLSGGGRREVSCPPPPRSW